VTARLAYFVTPHGFGHAARACAVIQALWARRSDLQVELFTTTPRWFFAESLRRRFGYHPCQCDVGLVQATSLHEDLAATARRLREALPYPRRRVEELAATVTALGCRAVVCDVAALGVAVARCAGLPAVVVENFTWDWIYAAYAGEHPAFAEAAAYLAEVLAGATRRIQCEPACAPLPGALGAPPIWRAPRHPAGEVRRRLGVENGRPLVLLTMGGVPWRWDRLDRLATSGDAVWVIPGAADVHERRGQCVLLPHRTGFYHPDLVRAADLVVGKLGYSTVAEVVGLWRRFAFVPRPSFPESPVLEAYVRARGACAEIPPERFASLEWASQVRELLVGPVPPLEERPSGALVVAQEVLIIADLVA